jgi:hypothetical protein
LTDRSSEIIPSSQARKLAFVSAKADKETTNPHALAAAPSPYAIMAGSIFPASLITGLNSDLPGSTIAQVTENVYDTVTGEHLLIRRARGCLANTIALSPMVRNGACGLDTPDAAERQFDRHREPASDGRGRLCRP